jgi:hypothetical protein
MALHGSYCISSCGGLYVHISAKIDCPATKRIGNALEFVRIPDKKIKFSGVEAVVAQVWAEMDLISVFGNKADKWTLINA